MPWFEYSRTAGSQAKPYVVVRLWHGAQSVQLLALVDSGADSSLLDASYADILGLDRGQAQVDSAVVASGGQTTVLRWPNAPLELQFENERFAFEGCFIDFPAGASPENLMGRRDFFQKFIVQFWDAQDLMNIDLSPDHARTSTTP